jgi:hypothetical protein
MTSAVSSSDWRPASRRCGAVGARAATLFQFLEAEHQLRRPGLDVGQALGLHDDDGAQRGQLRQRVEHLVGLLLVLAHHHLRVGMAEDVGDLVGRTGRVHAHRHRADQPGAQLRQQPLDPVLGQHPDVRAGLDAQRREAQADVDGALVQLRPGERLPDAVLRFWRDGVTRRHSRGVLRLVAQGLGQRKG